MLGNMGTIIDDRESRSDLLGNHSQLPGIALITAMNHKAFTFTLPPNIDTMKKCIRQVLTPKLQAFAFIDTDLNEISLPVAKAIKMMGIKAVISMLIKLITTRRFSSRSKADRKRRGLRHQVTAASSRP